MTAVSTERTSFSKMDPKKTFMYLGSRRPCGVATTNVSLGSICENALTVTTCYRYLLLRGPTASAIAAIKRQSAFAQAGLGSGAPFYR